MKVIDAKQAIVGRLGTRVAKMALEGQEIAIVNAEQAVISGSQDEVLAKYKQHLDRTVPLKGPYFPKQADRILKRNIRGMLPYKTPKGRAALDRIKCYVGVPAEFEGKAQVLEGTQKADVKSVSIQRISQHLGGRQ